MPVFSSLLPNNRSLLRVLVATRLVQSIAMGAYSISKDPTNEYLKLHAVPARRGLKNLWLADAAITARLFAEAHP